MHQLAAATGWGYKEIMEEVPIALGLQIIDAQHLKDGIIRERDFSSTAETDIIDKAFNNVKHGGESHN